MALSVKDNHGTNTAARARVNLKWWATEATKY
jgi:hypothetical protein